MRVLYLVFDTGYSGDVDLSEAAIAALRCDARSTAETGWVQVVEWYDELVALTDSPVHRLKRAVAVGEADGAPAGLAALEPLDPALPRY